MHPHGSVLLNNTLMPCPLKAKKSITPPLHLHTATPMRPPALKALHGIGPHHRWPASRISHAANIAKAAQWMVPQVCITWSARMSDSIIASQAILHVHKLLCYNGQHSCLKVPVLRHMPNTNTKPMLTTLQGPPALCLTCLAHISHRVQHTLPLHPAMWITTEL